MRYDNLKAFEKHLQGAAPSHFSPIYCIIGKNAFECQEGIDLLIPALLPLLPARAIALSRLDGLQLNEDELLSVLNERSLFSELRVIWIQHVDKLKKTVQEKCEKFFIAPLPSQYFILSGANFVKNSTFYKLIEKQGVILEFPEVKPWEKERWLAVWVERQVALAGKSMSSQTCQFFIKRMGMDQAVLAQELKKLFCYCIEKTEITPNNIDSICTRQTNDTIWQLGEAIFQRDTKKTLQIAFSLLKEGQSLLPLLRQIRAQFQTEYQICMLLAHGKKANDISLEFPYMKGQILERHLQHALNYGLASFKKGLLDLDAAELRAKNSSIDEKILVELLMIQLTIPL